MATPTDRHAPAPNPPGRGTSRARTSAIWIVIAALVTVAVVVIIMNSRVQELEVQSIPAQPESASEWVAGPVVDDTPPSTRRQAPPPAPAASAAPTVTPSPTPALPQASGPPVDARGYVDSPRCGANETAALIARTDRALVVICESAGGAYEYQGVRLSDGASLELDDVRPIPGGFEVRNGGTTYRLSPTELVVISGEELQSRDPMLDYRAAG